MDFKDIMSNLDFFRISKQAGFGDKKITHRNYLSLLCVMLFIAFIMNIFYSTIFNDSVQNIISFPNYSSDDITTDPKYCEFHKQYTMKYSLNIELETLGLAENNCKLRAYILNKESDQPLVKDFMESTKCDINIHQNTLKNRWNFMDPHIIKSNGTDSFIENQDISVEDLTCYSINNSYNYNYKLKEEEKDTDDIDENTTNIEEGSYLSSLKKLLFFSEEKHDKFINKEINTPTTTSKTTNECDNSNFSKKRSSYFDKESPSININKSKNKSNINGSNGGNAIPNSESIINNQKYKSYLNISGEKRNSIHSFHLPKINDQDDPNFYTVHFYYKCGETGKEDEDKAYIHKNNYLDNPFKVQAHVSIDDERVDLLNKNKPFIKNKDSYKQINFDSRKNLHDTAGIPDNKLDKINKVANYYLSYESNLIIDNDSYFYPYKINKQFITDNLYNSKTSSNYKNYKYKLSDDIFSEKYISDLKKAINITDDSPFIPVPREGDYYYLPAIKEGYTLLGNIFLINDSKKFNLVVRNYCTFSDVFVTTFVYFLVLILIIDFFLFFLELNFQYIRAVNSIFNIEIFKNRSHSMYSSLRARFSNMKINKENNINSEGDNTHKENTFVRNIKQDYIKRSNLKSINNINDFNPIGNRKINIICENRNNTANESKRSSNSKTSVENDNDRKKIETNSNNNVTDNYCDNHQISFEGVSNSYVVPEYNDINNNSANNNLIEDDILKKNKKYKIFPITPISNIYNASGNVINKYKQSFLSNNNNSAFLQFGNHKESLLENYNNYSDEYYNNINFCYKESCNNNSSNTNNTNNDCENICVCCKNRNSNVTDYENDNDNCLNNELYCDLSFTEKEKKSDEIGNSNNLNSNNDNSLNNTCNMLFKKRKNTSNKLIINDNVNYNITGSLNNFKKENKDNKYYKNKPKEESEQNNNYFNNKEEISDYQISNTIKEEVNDHMNPSICSSTKKLEDNYNEDKNRKCNHEIKDTKAFKNYRNTKPNDKIIPNNNNASDISKNIAKIKQNSRSFAYQSLRSSFANNINNEKLYKKNIHKTFGDKVRLNNYYILEEKQRNINITNSNNSNNNEEDASLSVNSSCNKNISYSEILFSKKCSNIDNTANQINTTTNENVDYTLSEKDCTNSISNNENDDINDVNEVSNTKNDCSQVTVDVAENNYIENPNYCIRMNDYNKSNTYVTPINQKNYFNNNSSVINNSTSLFDRKISQTCINNESSNINNNDCENNTIDKDSDDISGDRNKVSYNDCDSYYEIAYKTNKDIYNTNSNNKDDLLMLNDSDNIDNKGKESKVHESNSTNINNNIISMNKDISSHNKKFMRHTEKTSINTSNNINSIRISNETESNNILSNFSNCNIDNKISTGINVINNKNNKKNLDNIILPNEADITDQGTILKETENNEFISNDFLLNNNNDNSFVRKELKFKRTNNFDPNKEEINFIGKSYEFTFLDLLKFTCCPCISNIKNKLFREAKEKCFFYTSNKYYYAMCYLNEKEVNEVICNPLKMFNVKVFSQDEKYEIERNYKKNAYIKLERECSAKKNNNEKDLNNKEYHCNCRNCTDNNNNTGNANNTTNDNINNSDNNDNSCKLPNNNENSINPRPMTFKAFRKDSNKVSENDFYLEEQEIEN